MVHTEAELVHIGLHVLNRHMMIDSVHASLDDCPKGFNAVGVLSITFGELYLMVHHDTNEIIRVLNPNFVNDIVATVLLSHNRSAFLASIVQHLQQLLSSLFLSIGICGSHNTMHPTTTSFLHSDNRCFGR